MHRTARPVQHHAGAAAVCDQQPHLLGVRLTGGLLHPNGDHGGDVRADCATAAAQGALRGGTLWRRQRTVPPPGRPLPQASGQTPSLPQHFTPHALPRLGPRFRQVPGGSSCLVHSTYLPFEESQL